MTVGTRKLLIAVAAGLLAVVLATLVEMYITMAVILGLLVFGRLAFGDDPRARKLILVGLLVWVIALPLMHVESSGFIDTAVLALAYTVFALGLNIIVGFAGLLDLGYVAFFALGALAAGWFMSNFFSGANGGEGIHLLVGEQASALPGVHANFLIVIVVAVIVCTIAGMLIGLPTLRLRGDYIAIVTLAFGEIIGRIVINGDDLPFGLPQVTNGRQGITPIDKIDLPFLPTFEALNLRPWFWTALVLVLLVLFVNYRLRDSRLGRAWIALREDEVAASSMGVPIVKTKLLAYGTGASFGGIAGAFLASYLNTVNADQFQFFVSVFVLAMVILGGLGSIEGVVLGGIALTYINFRLLPGLSDLPASVGLDFDTTQLSFGIYGFLLVIIMVLRPEGLIPERRRKLELTEGIGVGTTTGVGGPRGGGGESVHEARA